MGASEISRRAFLAGRGASLPRAVLPPGASNPLSCTGCGACVDACPSGIISLVGGTLSLEFAIGECTFCGECRSVCPEPVFDAEAPRRFPHTVVISQSCFTKSGIACQSCRDVCPEQAIRFRPRIGGPFVPELDESACTGCGACIGVCPAGAVGVAERGREETHA